MRAIKTIAVVCVFTALVVISGLGMIEPHYNVLFKDGVNMNNTDSTVPVNHGTRALASSPWPMFHANLRHTGLSPYDTSKNPGKLKWCYLTGRRGVWSSPAIGGDGAIYFGSYDYKLYAIYPNGTLKWNFTTGGGVTSSPAIGGDGTIYVGSGDKKLYAINPDGTLKWAYTTGGLVTSSPAIGSDGTIYVGSWDNNLYAINLDGTLKWSYTTGGWVESSPAIGSEGTIYVGSNDNNVYAINPNGTLKWAYTTGGLVTSSPAIGSDGTIYVGSQYKNLYAINPNGTLKWAYTIGGVSHSSPAIGSDGTIYVGSMDCKLYAIKPDGTLKWSFTTGSAVTSSPAIGSDGTIYVGSYDGKLYAINPDGTLKWSYTTGGWVYSSPAIGSDGTIYVGSSDGKLYAFGWATEPSSPQNLTAISGNGTVTLSWSPPLDDGDSSIINYTIYRGTASGGETLLTTVGNVLNYTDTNLTNGVTYYYQVSAVNYVGEGPRSNEVSATPMRPPSAPRNLMAIPGNGTVALSWSPPNDDGSSPITNYRVYRGNMSGDETLLTTVGNNLTYIDTSVSNGLTYYYTVSAVNSAGEGPKSNEVSATPMAPPSPPRNLQAVAEDGKVTLSWEPPNEDGGSPVTSYNIYRRTSVEGNILLATVGYVHTYIDTNVTNGVQYYYRVSAVNVVGEGPMSNVASAKLLGPPSAPLNLQATKAIDGEVTLSWEPPADDGGSNITKYRIYRSTTLGNVTYYDSVEGTATSYVDTNASNGQTYYYRVSAVNVVGEGPMSNVAGAKPLGPPSAPLNLQAKVIDGKIVLSWSPPEDNGGMGIGGGIIEYRIYRGESPGGEEYYARVDGATTTYGDASVNNGVTYYYKVSAVNGIGESPSSKEVYVTLKTEVDNDGNESAYTETSFQVWVWALPVTVIGFVIVIVAVLFVLRRRKGGKSTQMVPIEPYQQPSETPTGQQQTHQPSMADYDPYPTSQYQPQKTPTHGQYPPYYQRPPYSQQ